MSNETVPKEMVAAEHVSRSSKANADLIEALEHSQESEARLRIMIDAIPAIAWSNRPDGSNEFVNERWCEFTGLSGKEAYAWGWKPTIHPDDLSAVMDKWFALVASGEPGEFEVRLRRHDGEYRWFLLRAEVVRNEQGNIARWYGTHTDIEDLKRAQALLATEKGTLELAVCGASLNDVLEHLCTTIDAQAPETLSTVLLMDKSGKYLWPTAGKRAPKDWLKALSPLPVGPEMGSCGTAAFRKGRVICADIANDSLWSGIAASECRKLAALHGLRSAWSQPLVTKDGEVLGTFAMYHPKPRIPDDNDLQLLERAAHVALIAIERDRSEAALNHALSELRRSEAQLRQDEKELRTITDAIPNVVAVLGPAGNCLYVNKSMLNYTGLSIDQSLLPGFWERAFHPEDVERLRDDLQTALSSEHSFENEQRIQRSDGEYRWFYMHYNPYRNDEGRIVRWYATGSDIDERKRAEERTKNENLALREDIDRSSMFEEIVGSSKVLREVLSQVAKVAPTDSTVLILGETGTGKELIARAIHKRSKRSGRAFIRVNCAAIPASLIASELFGYEKGAFTGALQRRLGRFEAADGGTIFLDEVGELPTEVQITLLRVLQEREFERVGSNHPISVNVRVIAATNRNLEMALAEGTFRQDLFYRLNVFPLRIPSLRERADDIPLLVEYLIERFSKRAGKRVRHIGKTTMQLFQDYDWPGNIRELQNVIERAIILCDSETFAVDEAWLKRKPPAPPSSIALATGVTTDAERKMIESALKASKGRISGPLGAAVKLNMPRQTLESKLKMLQINKHGYKTV
jgi:formate hydrogenlyase transcriptional activator